MRRSFKLKIAFRKYGYAVLCRGRVVFRHRDMDAVRIFMAAFNETEMEPDETQMPLR
jgi:hypothetical protein